MRSCSVMGLEGGFWGCNIKIKGRGVDSLPVS